MVDGDLQYPPSAIPCMLTELTKSGTDIVVANRKQYNENPVRKFITSGLSLFWQNVFWVKYRYSIRLKAFTSQVYKTIKFDPHSPWNLTWNFFIEQEALDSV